jgi:hypothetical protein
VIISRRIAAQIWMQTGDQNSLKNYWRIGWSLPLRATVDPWMIPSVTGAWIWSFRKPI